MPSKPVDINGLQAVKRKTNKPLKIIYNIEFNHKKIKMVTGVISPGVFKYYSNLRGTSGMLWT